tara:strand:- start:483 stop:596 length:114 start_codon:yes stop_codon:yes gene_type:complete
MDNSSENVVEFTYLTGIQQHCEQGHLSHRSGAAIGGG